MALAGPVRAHHNVMGHLRCTALQTVQSLQVCAQASIMAPRRSALIGRERSRCDEHGAGSKRPNRLCGARKLNHARNPREEAQEASPRRTVRDAHRRRALHRVHLAPIHSFHPCFRSDAKGNNNLVSQVDRLTRPRTCTGCTRSGRAQAAQARITATQTSMCASVAQKV